MSSDIRLTQTVQKGGCAAKVAATELRAILQQVRFPPTTPALLVDGATFDDAAIYKISEEVALVQTLDFFTPIVDTPKVFGRIAAANALSDVYAMGGEPDTAMAILAFPLAALHPTIAVDVLQGACDVLAEAGAALVGGHSIDDDTLKFGLSVTGRVHPGRVWSNAGAKPGDVLILTKALGTGTLTAGLKRGVWNEDDISEAIVSMGTLNRVRDLLAPDQLDGIHAATDVTGFGLLGHLRHISKASGVSCDVSFASLPWLEKAATGLTEGFLTKAHRTNAEYTVDCVLDGMIDPVAAKILWDPQTSGGLCLAVAPEHAEDVLAGLRRRFPRATIIGRFTAATAAPIRIAP